MPAPTIEDFDPKGGPVVVRFEFDSSVNAQYHLQCYTPGVAMVKAGPGFNTDEDENEVLTVPISASKLEATKVFWIIQFLSLPGLSDDYDIVVTVEQDDEVLHEEHYKGEMTEPDTHAQLVGGVLFEEGSQ